MFGKGFGSSAASVAAVIAVMIGLVLVSPGQAEACGAKGFVREVSGKMLGAAKSGSVNKFRDLIKTYADVGAIGNFALGKHHRQQSMRSV